jgi:FkbM family methyltransferase
VRYLLRKIKNLLYKIPVLPASTLLLQSQRVIPWFQNNGDKTHRLDYELDNNSIVWDLGGYEGQWAADIFCRYGCRVEIFEPVPDYVQKIQQRFANNLKVSVHPFGLAEKDSKEKLSLSADRSSLFTSSENLIEIDLVEAAKFIFHNQTQSIDLMKINIEGGEYILLEHLIEKDLISKIKNIQIQFHDFIPDALSRMKSIQQNLKKTHYLTYQYEFVWENWALKKQ